MVLSPWKTETEARYIELIGYLHPDEVQLNRPTRPRPLDRQLSARSNDPPIDRIEVWQTLKCVSLDVLSTLAAKIYQSTEIPVRVPPG
jgi:wyosine [tRNA(Phe)-imidazoG37] synthetase (radical SAM superfamily)